MGLPQHNPCVKRGATRHLPARVCLRKDCGLIFQPRRWNQRYCGDPDCRQSVLRWQAAKRQRAHRRSAENRKRHAEAEARRRRLAKSQSADTPVTPQQVASPDQAPRPVIARAPGGTPKPPRPGRAWSRSKEIPEKFCDRPGCYSLSAHRIINFREFIAARRVRVGLDSWSERLLHSCGVDI